MCSLSKYRSKVLVYKLLSFVSLSIKFNIDFYKNTIKIKSFYFIYYRILFNKHRWFMQISHLVTDIRVGLKNLLCSKQTKYSLANIVVYSEC